MRGDHAVTRFESRKAAALLACLALYPQRLHSREALGELLWPDENPEATRNRFKQVLSLLRRELEPPGTESGSVLATDRTHVRLQRGTLTSDVAEFEAALAEARTAEGAARAAALERAVELYRGELLPGFYEDFVAAERQRLAEAYLDAVENLARLLMETGHAGRAIDYAHRALAADPLREASHLTLIQLLAATGRTADALRQYGELERLLQENLDTTPSAAAQALMEQIRRQEVPTRPTPLLAMAASVTQTSMPLPHPRAPEPEAAGREVRFIPPALPTPLTRFFGREAEMGRLARLLQPGSGGRLVTLMGPAGSGKSRLSIEAARTVRPEFRGNVWWVSLAAKTSVRAAVEAIVTALGLPVDDEEPLERVIGFLNSRGIEGEEAAALLVLDNFEHLLTGLEGSPAAELVSHLLQRAPCLTCLVTSRQRLEISGERVFPVLPLSTPTGAPALDQLAATPSVQLFTDRAQAADPNFELTAENAATVAELCQRLEGIPLAIELAAAWAAELSTAQMLQRLSRRFELLVSRQRDLDSRHQSLRAALEWSYQQIDPLLQRFYLGMSAFRGGASLEAAEAVAGRFVRQGPHGMEEGPSALECLSQLRARSLLEAEPCGDATRYRLMETLREHAAEQLTGAERATLGRLHALYFTEVAETAERELDGPGQAAWLQALDADHDNLRAALGWADASGEVELLGRLAGALVEFWERRGYFHEGREWLGRVRPYKDEFPAVTRALVLRGDGVLAWYHQELSAARRSLEEALAGYEELGGTRGQAIVLTRLANVALAEEQYAEAQALHEQALALFRRVGDAAKTAWVLRSLGETAAMQRDFGAAMTLFQQSLAICRELGELRGIAGSLTYIGGVARAEGNAELARSATQEALAIHQALGDRSARSNALDCLACLAAAEGDWEQAYHLAREAVTLHRELGQPLLINWLLEELARLLADLGRMQRAALLWGAAIRADTLHPARTEERLGRDPNVDLTRMMLGDDEFDEALRKGKALTAERVLGVVLFGEPLPAA